MFNKIERQRLESLSLSVLGSTNAYTKLLKDPTFKVLVGYKEVEEKFYYHDKPVKYDARAGKTKTVREKIANQAPYPKVQQPVYRDLTFVELEGALLGASEMKGFSEILKRDEGLFYEELVRKYKDGSIINKPYLFVSEADKPEFDSLFEQLPQEQKDVLTPYVVPNQNQGVFSVTGSKLVAELVYQNSHSSQE